MNTHMTTVEYAEGYEAYDPDVLSIAARRSKCPYAAGSTSAMLWIEGWNDARDDAAREAARAVK